MSASWYYTRDGKPCGPVSEDDFNALVKAGTVAPQTLVWRESMAAWRPYAEIADLASQPGVEGKAQCFECQGWFALDDVIPFEGRHICGGCKPQFFQKVREGVSLFEEGLWRDGPFLLVARGARMPDRCVRCNRPALGFRVAAKTGTLLEYVKGRGLVLERVPVSVPLCSIHRRMRKWLCMAAVSLFPAAVVVSMLIRGGAFALIFLLVVALLMAISIWKASRFLGLAGGSMSHSRFSGAGRAFLDSLPEWRGRSGRS